MFPPHLLLGYGNALIPVFLTYLPPLGNSKMKLCPLCCMHLRSFNFFMHFSKLHIFSIFFSGRFENNTSISRRISTRLGAFLWEGYQDKRWLVWYRPSSCVISEEILFADNSLLLFRFKLCWTRMPLLSEVTHVNYWWILWWMYKLPYVASAIFMIWAMCFCWIQFSRTRCIINQ